MNSQFGKEAARIRKELLNELNMTVEKPSEYSLRKRQKKILRITRSIQNLQMLVVDDEEKGILRELENKYSEQLGNLVIDNL